MRAARMHGWLSSPSPPSGSTPSRICHRSPAKSGVTAARNSQSTDSGLTRRTSLVSIGLVALHGLLPAPVLSESKVLLSQNPSTVDPADQAISQPAPTVYPHTEPNGQPSQGSSQMDDALGSSSQTTETPPSSSDGEPEKNFNAAPLESFDLTEEAEKRLLEEEEARRKVRTKRRGRIRELEETRSELAEKQLTLLLKETELLEKEQTLVVLREELQLERRLRALLTKEKEKAEEEAALAMGLCSGANLLP